MEFSSGDKWPPDLAELYHEAARCFSANAFTAAAMVCRKILMVCAMEQGDKPGRNFIEYVDYITNTVLNFPQAKKAIDAIRGIGNDATHKVAFVSEADARRAMQIADYTLRTIYTLPGA
jgi:Domain of unknown function (DUF4145)